MATLRHISRGCSGNTQTNYKTYLQNVRIEYGFQELANTDHTIGEIALNNGFPNQKAFTREFKRNTEFCQVNIEEDKKCQRLAKIWVEKDKKELI